LYESLKETKLKITPTLVYIDYQLDAPIIIYS